MSDNRTGNRPFHIMTKPIGPKCNLDCKYCFYLEKESLWERGERYKMSLETLETYIRSYIEAQPNEQVSFAWQGGEPTLMGIEFFRKVVELQKTYANGKHIENAFQTNGTLLDDEWGHFFRENHFLVGLSIDGPQKMHDSYRINKRGQGTWDQVMRGLEILKKHQVDWNSLTCVHRGNSHKPLDVYRFLKGIGSRHLQFIPIVERKPNATAKQLGLTHATPAELDRLLSDEEASPVTSWSVKPGDYGRFLTAIFDRWIRKDVGKVFIQINEVTLGKYIDGRPGICIFEETCGDALALEHDGSLYACDHYVYPTHRLGDLNDKNLIDMVESSFQKDFGSAKRDKLPPQCIQCEVRSLCNGGCPKQRFLADREGNPGLNYLCEGYYHFFTHTRPHMQRIAQMLRYGYPATKIMEDF